MARDERQNAHRAEEVRSAVARLVHELGITVVVFDTSRRAVLDGQVATEERRTEIGKIAGLVLTDFEIQNRIVVTAMAPPRLEELP